MDRHPAETLASIKCLLGRDDASPREFLDTCQWKGLFDDDNCPSEKSLQRFDQNPSRSVRRHVAQKPLLIALQRVLFGNEAADLVAIYVDFQMARDLSEDRRRKAAQLLLLLASSHAAECAAAQRAYYQGIALYYLGSELDKAREGRERDIVERAILTCRVEPRASEARQDILLLAHQYFRDIETGNTPGPSGADVRVQNALRQRAGIAAYAIQIELMSVAPDHPQIEPMGDLTTAASSGLRVVHELLRVEEKNFTAMVSGLFFAAVLAKDLASTDRAREEARDLWARLAAFGFTTHSQLPAAGRALADATTEQDRWLLLAIDDAFTSTAS